MRSPDLLITGSWVSAPIPIDAATAAVIIKGKRDVGNQNERDGRNRIRPMPLLAIQ